MTAVAKTVSRNEVGSLQPAEIHRLKSLAEIARLISSSSDLPSVLNRIVAAVCQHSSWNSCGIMGVNRKAQLSELIVRFDPRLDPRTNPPTSWKLEHSGTVRALETNRPVIIEDAQICDEFLAYKEDSLLRGYHTVVVLPFGNTDLLGREMTIAVHSLDKVVVSESELAFLVTITQLASVAVDKAKSIRLEQDRAQRLRQTIEISTQLMERVLSEGSPDSFVEMVAVVLPFPLIIVDLATGTFSVRRSPAPAVLSESEWRNLVNRDLSPEINALLRSSASRGCKTGHDLSFIHGNSTLTLKPLVELLQVNNETVGGLIVFPQEGGLDDFDGMVAQAVKLALNVQVMRDYLSFRSKANSLAEIFKTLFAGAPRNSTELLARAERHGVLLAGPARLVAISSGAEEGQGEHVSRSSLHLSLSRVAANMRPGATVFADEGDLVVYVPVCDKEDAGGWDRFVRGLLAAVEMHTGVRGIAAESRVCRQLLDYREARTECGRILSLARMFKRQGHLSQADFGPFAVMLSAVEQTSARDFVKNTLGAIEEYDAKHHGELLSTMTQFVRSGCRYQACADQLVIHVSTLRYRLNRLHELFAIDFENSDTVFGLMLALRLRELGSPSASRAPVQ